MRKMRGVRDGEVIANCKLRKRSAPLRVRVSVRFGYAKRAASAYCELRSGNFLTCLAFLTEPIIPAFATIGSGDKISRTI